MSRVIYVHSNAPIIKMTVNKILARNVLELKQQKFNFSPKDLLSNHKAI